MSDNPYDQFSEYSEPGRTSIQTPEAHLDSRFYIGVAWTLLFTSPFWTLFIIAAFAWEKTH